MLIRITVMLNRWISNKQLNAKGKQTFASNPKACYTDRKSELRILCGSV